MSDFAPDTPRTRTFSWDDPMKGASAAKSLSGIEYMRAMLRGELPKPPISDLMNFVLESVEEGKAVFTGEPAEYHYNPIGVVHGGLMATLLDSALGCCVHTTLPAGVGYTTLELHVNMIRAVTINTGRLWAIGEVIHVGRTTATAQAKIIDAQGKLYAHGTTTCIIFRPDEGK